MKVNRRIATIAATVAAVAVGGSGIAYAVGGGSDGKVGGAEAENAKRAALEAAGGGTVVEVERQDGDGAGVFEVEIRRDDGSQVEIHLDASYEPVGTAPDDDTGSDSDDDSGEGTDGDR